MLIQNVRFLKPSRIDGVTAKSEERAHNLFINGVNGSYCWDRNAFGIQLKQNSNELSSVRYAN